MRLRVGGSALVSVGLPYARRHIHRAVIHEHGEGESFQGNLLAPEMSGDAYEIRSRGLVYDLDDLFDRVNAEYFGGAMTKPCLTWNRALTSQEFGCYQEAADTVVGSIALDAPPVPAFVVQHVMHHELLHRKLGARRVNGGRTVHTAAFRRGGCVAPFAGGEDQRATSVIEAAGSVRQESEEEKAGR